MVESYLQKLALKQFRCFDSVEFEFDGPLTLIYGLNGSGKTSLLEALHYLCYLRSFRTHIPKDMAQFGTDGFFIKAVFNNQEIKIGCSGSKRHIKIDQKTINSYQELRQAYRVITVTEDDLQIVKGGPDKRRSFLDHALLLRYPELLPLFKQFKTVLDQRNALLQHNNIAHDELQVWTTALENVSAQIQEQRISFVQELQTTINTLIAQEWDTSYTIKLSYEIKKEQTDKNHLKALEMRYKRSLFGAHLDDVTITFQNKPARLFSSRGQQKLIVLLIKLAQVQQFLASCGTCTFLLDDFMTDFDKVVMKNLIDSCIKLKTQLIFTSPAPDSPECAYLKQCGAQEINLTK